MANPTKKDVVYFQPQAHEPIIGNQMQRMCNVISTLNDEMNNVEHFTCFPEDHKFPRPSK